MKKFFNSDLCNTIIIFLIGILAFFTKELVTFFMLGFIMIMLSNVCDKLDDISRKLDNK